MSDAEHARFCLLVFGLGVAVIATLFGGEPTSCYGWTP